MNRQPFPMMCRLYRMLIALYPIDHRRAYGELMVQLFRDQCHDAACDARPFRTARLCARIMRDLIFSLGHEHVCNLMNHMKTTSINKLTHILFAAAIALALLTHPAVSGPAMATMFLYLSTLAILARAVAEWFRPTGETAQAIGWGVSVLIAFAFIMPFWAKLHAVHGSAFLLIPAFHGGAVFLNLIVPIARALIDRSRRTA